MAGLKAILDEKRLFRSRLLRWYDVNRRELPWRQTRDPYRVWVSEIMLQQTRVNAVMGHYRRFLEAFPTVDALANASEAEVLTAWSGLGYYRRARMMRAAAQEIVASDGGAFPGTAAELQMLPGIGRYTAAAIASIAHDEACAVVDGNVERVVERLAGRALPQKAVWEFAQGLIATERPGDFNQAMMELGATVCMPQARWCGECPVRSFCRSRGKESVAKRRPERLSATLHYVYARQNGAVRLVQRSPRASVMAGMWELPETEMSGTEATTPLAKLRHSITTTDYLVFIHAGRARRGKWIALERVPTLPLTGLARKALVKLGAIASLA